MRWAKQWALISRHFPVKVFHAWVSTSFRPSEMSDIQDQLLWNHAWFAWNCFISDKNGVLLLCVLHGIRLTCNLNVRLKPHRLDRAIKKIKEHKGNKETSWEIDWKNYNLRTSDGIESWSQREENLHLETTGKLNFTTQFTHSHFQSFGLFVKSCDLSRYIHPKDNISWQFIFIFPVCIR